MAEMNSGGRAEEVAYKSAGPILALMVAGSLGVLAALLVAPIWSPSLAASLMGSSPKAYWYLSRATAFAALGLLWLSMVMGLLISDKIARAWPGAQAAFSIHEYVSLLGLGFAAFHALILLGDRYIGYDLRQILLPFASEGYRPLWIGLGQLGLYFWAIISVTFYVKQRIGHKAWRLDPLRELLQFHGRNTAWHLKRHRHGSTLGASGLLDLRGKRVFPYGVSADRQPEHTRRCGGAASQVPGLAAITCCARP